MLTSSLFADYVSFHRIQIANRDVDPVYPVLRAVGDQLGWDAEDRIRSVFIHVAYYDFGSALAALRPSGHGFERAFTDPVPGLKCGTERRRHRMRNHLAEHLSDLARIAGEWYGLGDWIGNELGNDPTANWRIVTDRLLEVTGNGRWAAFKTCEMLAEVCGLPLAAPDMGHANSSGPRKGLGLLYPGMRLPGNRPEVIRVLDQASTTVVEELRRRGCEARLETAETTLCDFHSLVEGRYYPGLDIDVMQEQLATAPLSPEMRRTAYLARESSLPHAYLGEWDDRWRGPDRARKQVYRKTGEIVERG